MNQRPELGRVGVWIGGAPSAELAIDLEHLGYGTIWIGGSPGGTLAEVESTLAATSRITVATGIVNIWKDDPEIIGAAHARLSHSYGGRFLLGVGAGHPEATSSGSPRTGRRARTRIWSHPSTPGAPGSYSAPPL